MVKITNLTGDVKIGKQGAVVYQRKYGEQIRRGVSPKRAIASEAQIAHRQLYRDALKWRSNLSLPNRRYLEGYTYSNGVVDSYHAPLGWSKFALKLYLEKVKFAPFLVTTELVGEEAVDQQYTTGDSAAYTSNDTKWLAQTFTPATTGKITKVKLKIYRNTSAADFIVKITTTDGEGKPTDTILCSKTFNTEPITTESPGDWYEFSFEEPATLTKDTVYAILIHGMPGLPNPYLMWRDDASAPQYLRGCHYYSSNSGGSWTRYLYDDFMFQTFAFFPGEKITSGTLHVKHPALMKVLQKRGELTVNGYDGLSSLNDEYLTGQVGLDVEEGDLIWATTLAGVLYPYLVK
ncbi:hypothetical protein ES708_25497 [subsurface metagenome]